MIKSLLGLIGIAAVFAASAAYAQSALWRSAAQTRQVQVAASASTPPTDYAIIMLDSDLPIALRPEYERYAAPTPEDAAERGLILLAYAPGWRPCLRPESELFYSPAYIE